MYFLADIGGTKTRLGFSFDGKEVQGRGVFPTPSEYQEGLSVIRSYFESKSLRGKVKSAAVGIAGPLDKEKTMLIGSPNLPLWARKFLARDIGEIIETPVLLENDCSLIALGEAVRGAGQEKGIVAYLGIGTGVGGARIVDGKLDRCAVGFEPGHQIIDCSRSFYDSCGPWGHLEALVSGNGIERIFGQKPETITDMKIFEDVARVLAYGINNTIVYWSPDVVVLGGSLMKIISIDLVKFYLEEVFKIYPEIPEIKNAILGDAAGLYGGLALLAQKNNPNISGSF